MNYDSIIDFFNVKGATSKINPLKKTLIYIFENDNFENKRLVNYIFKNTTKPLVNTGHYFISSKNKSVFIGNILNLTLKNNKNIRNELLIYELISIALADVVIINKVNNIKLGFELLDFALDLGKDVYAVPGDIYNSDSYLSNYSIKTGAVPICTKRDGMEILLQNYHKK